jgi:ammonia channel protein AmtB
MPRSLGNLWKDESGALLVTEWVFVATILVLGILPMVVSLRSRVNQTATQMDALNEIPVLSCGTSTPN